MPKVPSDFTKYAYVVKGKMFVFLNEPLYLINQ